MKTKKNIVKLTENELKKVIAESVKKTINEVNLQKGKQFIMEGMEAPNEVRRVWAHKKGGYYIALGADGTYYEIFPDENDSYRIKNNSGKFIEEIGKKVEQAYRNKGIKVSFLNYFDTRLIIEFRSQEDFKKGFEFEKPLQAWLENKGFKLVDRDEMNIAYQYELVNGDNSYNVNEIDEMLEDFIEITGKIQNEIRSMDSIQLFRSLDSLMEDEDIGQVRHGVDPHGILDGVTSIGGYERCAEDLTIVFEKGKTERLDGIVYVGHINDEKSKEWEKRSWEEKDFLKKYWCVTGCVFDWTELHPWTAWKGKELQLYLS